MKVRLKHVLIGIILSHEGIDEFVEPGDICHAFTALFWAVFHLLRQDSAFESAEEIGVERKRREAPGATEGAAYRAVWIFPCIDAVGFLQPLAFLIIQCLVDETEGGDFFSVEYEGSERRDNARGFIGFHNFFKP